MARAKHKIFMTKDYSQFRYIRSNRQVSKEKVKRLVEAIRRDGFLAEEVKDDD